MQTSHPQIASSLSKFAKRLDSHYASVNTILLPNPAFRQRSGLHPIPFNISQTTPHVESILTALFQPSDLNEKRIRFYLDDLHFHRGQNDRDNDPMALVIFLALGTIWNDLPNLRVIETRFWQTRPFTRYKSLSNVERQIMAVAENQIDSDKRDKIESMDIKLSAQELLSTCQAFSLASRLSPTPFLGIGGNRLQSMIDRAITIRVKDGQFRPLHDYCPIREVYIGYQILWRKGHLSAYKELRSAEGYKTRMWARNYTFLCLAHIYDGKYALTNGHLVHMSKSVMRNWFKMGETRESMFKWVRKASIEILGESEEDNELSIILDTKPNPQRHVYFAAIHQNALDAGTVISSRLLRKTLIRAYRAFDAHLHRKANDIGKRWTFSEEVILGQYLLNNALIDFNYIHSLLPTRTVHSIKARMSDQSDRVLDIIDFVEGGMDEEKSEDEDSSDEGDSGC